jgi:hypothetical protein
MRSDGSRQMNVAVTSLGKWLTFETRSLSHCLALAGARERSADIPSSRPGLHVQRQRGVIGKELWDGVAVDVCG